MSTTNIFLTGATGYLGGSILWRLLQHRNAPTFRIKALIRDKRRAKLFSDNYPIDTIIGCLEELEKLENLVAEADIVIATADVVNYEAAQAILKGLKRRYNATGQRSIFIQTSGTGVLDDDAQGMYESEKVFSDMVVEDMEALPLTQPHRLIDSIVTEADTEGYTRTYIVFPSTVYGIVKNGFTEAGLQNPVSIQIPYLIRAGLDRGQGGVVGLGLNRWPNVHIDDQADLYMAVFDGALKGEGEGAIPHGRQGMYYAEAGEHVLIDICTRISEVLYSLGKAEGPVPTLFSREECLKYFGDGPDWFGSNSRCIAPRSRSIGWKPAYTTDDLLSSIRPEVEAIIKSRRL